MTTKRIQYVGAGFLLFVGAFFSVIAILHLDGVSSHGWSNVVQTGTVALIALIGGALSLWDIRRTS
jgi:hypothetical protein